LSWHTSGAERKPIKESGGYSDFPVAPTRKQNRKGAGRSRGAGWACALVTSILSETALLTALSAWTARRRGLGLKADGFPEQQHVAFIGGVGHCIRHARSSYNLWGRIDTASAWGPAAGPSVDRPFLRSKEGDQACTAGTGCCSWPPLFAASPGIRMGHDGSDTYVLRGGQKGAERLRLLARVKWPTTKTLLRRFGLRPGMHCLDVG